MKAGCDLLVSIYLSFLWALSLSCAAAAHTYGTPSAFPGAESSSISSASSSSWNKTKTLLHMTALTNHPVPPYLARVQCWALSAGFTVYPTVGHALALGAVDNATYVVLPPRGAEGWHRPPHPMFFVLLSGVAQVYVPNAGGGDDRGEGATDSSGTDGFGSDGDYGYDHGRGLQQQQHQEQRQSQHRQPPPDDEGWTTLAITPGSPHQILIAADTDARAKGHLTFYPGDGETVALQIPFRDTAVPPHMVVHEGPCRGDE
ncbi:uncharacterized protein Z519_03992 [Cladophialophora bantiana CBS 173.52]|uniref:Cupin type-1 domain-containing protein n=1 Tax=Cladophialophora bantiana (strain ATCC 10958 / CBS 173.52 / CDC B-1940 / NIH 8579) TaxID=1442370 RepID=A0A0D2HPQ8_CLAB1|nr:uncharacterized protein Z519_03992 [Cladophialophora bantiana CBS 173.52]KIW95408.1 hypothetical protein Z519_03992 [Cladophialophora bantiana CBS 173.52]